MSLVGSVKFFDTKKGWGFITVLSQGVDQSNTEVFVHFSNLNVSDNAYKRLFPGEYVSFSIGKNKQGQDTCIDVTGVMGGPLLADHPEHRYKIYPKDSRPSRSEEPPTESADNAEDAEDAEDAGAEDENDPEA